MPGIVGIVRTPGISVSFGKAIKKLLHFPAYYSRSLDLSDAVSIGQVWRKERENKGAWHFDHIRKAGAFINGAILVPSPAPRRLSAKDVLEDYLHSRDFPCFDGYEGAFVVVIVDLMRNLLFVCNDRVGSLPVYYMKNQKAFCFAPEVKAVLTALKKQPKLSMAGVISFLATGYCLADTTLFENVNYLEPGCVLSLDIKSLELHKTRYWKIVFEPNPSLQQKKAAEDTLYKAIVDAHRLITADRPEKFELYLSGGWDSRGNLAVLDQIGILPKRAFCWGLRDDIPHSDGYIAKSLAREYSVPFDFLSYDTDRFIENAREWVYLSELANDNTGWYAEGSSVLAKDYDTGADFAIKGDESWGCRGLVYNKTEAIGAVLPSTFPPAMKKGIAAHYLDEVDEIYKSQIRKVLKWCDNDNFVDIKDFLYLHGRTARLVFSQGYYIELAMEIRRPFLASNVLEIIRCLPAKYRAWKNLYIGMLKRYLPRSARFPANTVNSFPDWRYDVRNNAEIREFFLRHLDPERITSGILGKLLDARGFREIRDGFFLAEARPMRRIPPNRISTMKSSLSPLVNRTQFLDRLAKRILKKSEERVRDSFDFLRCVTLIRLLEEQMSTFSEPDA